MTGVVGALAVSIGGLVMSLTGSLLATSHDGAAEIAPYVSHGGTGAAVLALIWVVKKVVAGELVPRNVAEADRAIVRITEALERFDVDTHRSSKARTRTND